MSNIDFADAASEVFENSTLITIINVANGYVVKDHRLKTSNIFSSFEAIADIYANADDQRSSDPKFINFKNSKTESVEMLKEIKDYVQSGRRVLAIKKLMHVFENHFGLLEAKTLLDVLVDRKA